jgi:hypothetical protein
VETQNEPFISSHDAVLSRLEYWQNKDGKLHYYPSNEFQTALSTFNDLKIIYAKKHPSKGIIGQNLEEVLKEVDGRITGYTSSSLVNNTGSEFLKSVFNITDPEIDQKIRNKELSLSLGFR